MLQHLYTLIICILLLAGCKNSQRNIVISQEKNKTGQKSDPTKISFTQPQPIAPQYCRLIGTLAELQIGEDNQKSRCKIDPCYAMIKIKQVLGYGSSFPTTFQSGDEVLVFFPMSLNATDQMPGLDQDDRFKADMEGAISLSSVSNQPTYTIYSYESQ